MSADNQVAKTARHAAIYAVGTIVRSVTAIIMLPIYTRFLTPKDYGVLELLTGLIDFAAIIIGIRITEALFRFYTTASDAERKKAVASTTLILVMATSAIGAAAIWMSSTSLSRLLFEVEAYSFEVSLFGLSLMALAVNQTVMALLRAQQRPLVYVAVSIVTLVLQVSANIYFVIIRDMHVLGVVLAGVASGFAVMAFLLPMALRSVGIRFSKALLAELSAFAWPLVVASLVAFGSYYMDRYLLRVYLDLAAVGIYALAFKLTFVAKDLVSEPFHQAWAAVRFQIYASGKNFDSFGLAFKLLSGLVIVVVTSVALFAADLLQIMSAPEFWGAANVVPILAIGAGAQALIPFCDFGILVAKRTHHLARAALFSMLLKGLLLLALIPFFGVYGAAAGVSIGIVGELVWTYYRSHKYFDMSLDWRLLQYGTLIGSAIVGVSLLTPTTLGVGIVWHMSLWAAFPVILYFLPLWSFSERAILRRLVRRPWELREILKVGA